MKSTFCIGNLRVGIGEEPLVIPEMGINHEGSLEVAKLIVDAAARAGAKIIKHQTHIVEDEMSHAAKKVIPGNTDVSIYEVMERCALDEEEEFETEEVKQTPMEVEPRELIKGVSGLAEFLGCGSTKAQNIINSKILQERDIAYRAGNRWRFSKTLLPKLLEEEPEILNKVCSEAA